MVLVCVYIFPRLNPQKKETKLNRIRQFWSQLWICELYYWRLQKILMILSELIKDFMCFCFPFYFSLFYWEIGNKTVTCLHKSVSKENNKIFTNHHPPQTTNKLKDFKNFLYCVNYSFFFFWCYVFIRWNLYGAWTWQKHLPIFISAVSSAEFYYQKKR